MLENSSTEGAMLMDLMSITNLVDNFVKTANEALWSLPFLFFIVVVGCIITVALRFIQIRKFITGWRLIVAKDTGNKESQTADMSPFQAFLNTLSVSIGNGSLAGVAVAIATGGPGAAFWIFVVGLLSMSVRFAEGCLGVIF